MPFELTTQKLEDVLLDGNTPQNSGRSLSVLEIKNCKFMIELLDHSKHQVLSILGKTGKFERNAFKRAGIKPQMFILYTAVENSHVSVEGWLELLANACAMLALSVRWKASYRLFLDKDAHNDFADFLKACVECFCTTKLIFDTNGYVLGHSGWAELLHRLSSIRLQRYEIGGDQITLRKVIESLLFLVPVYSRKDVTVKVLRFASKGPFVDLGMEALTMTDSIRRMLDATQVALLLATSKYRKEQDRSLWAVRNGVSRWVDLEFEVHHLRTGYKE